MELPASGELTVKTLVELQEEDASAGQKPVESGADTGTWPGGIPKSYTILKDDKVWVIVVKRWGLKESFIQEIEGANPKIDFKRLRPGMVIVVPDPSRFVRSVAEPVPAPPKTGATRRYEVQGGDTLESIAYRHLGSKTRWPDIVSLNPGLEPKRLFEGQEIYLPVK
jgi:nucleoid-associated protein YgaU